MRRRQANGEFPADVEPGYLLIALQGILSAPVTMPHQVELLCGISPDSPEFAEQFGEGCGGCLRTCVGPERRGERRTRRAGDAAWKAGHGRRMDG